jgi:hypothetical protein
MSGDHEQAESQEYKGEHRMSWREDQCRGKDRNTKIKAELESHQHGHPEDPEREEESR